jgi:hypothetical protein
MKFCRAISRVKWFNGKKNQRFEDHLCLRRQGADMDIRDGLRNVVFFQPLTT